MAVAVKTRQAGIKQHPEMFPIVGPNRPIARDQQLEFLVDLRDREKDDSSAEADTKTIQECHRKGKGHCKNATGLFVIILLHKCALHNVS